MQSIEELKKAMSEALAKDDTAEVLRISSEIHKQKQAVAKAEAEKVKAEGEKLAGAREKLAKLILASVNKALPTVVADLEAMKANGFTFHRRGVLDANGVPMATSSVGLLVPTVRARGGGGGGAGKTKAEFGMSLGELVDKYATDDEKAEIANAASGSQSWQLKVAVKKRLIADGTIAPTK